MRKKHRRHNDQPLWSKIKNYTPNTKNSKARSFLREIPGFFFSSSRTWVSGGVSRREIDTNIEFCFFTNLCRSKSRTCRNFKCRHESVWAPRVDDPSQCIYIGIGL